MMTLGGRRAASPWEITVIVAGDGFPGGFMVRKHGPGGINSW